MGSRVDLQIELETVLGSRNVYFQPPQSLKMKYPAIIYDFARINVKKANNQPYLKDRNYTVTLVHNDPDNTLVDELLEHFMFISLDRPYVADGLYHYVFSLFY